MTPAHAPPPASLGVVPRILLATDGTLTHILEAYAAEPVHLVKLLHAPVTDPEVRAELGLDPGERALRRVILLRGTKSDVTYVHADSVVLLDRLPPVVAEGLQETDTPMGKLLFSCRAETLREILVVGQERNSAVAQHVDRSGDEPLATRTYQIIYAGRSVARITESFPTTAWPDPFTPTAAGSVDISDLGVIPRILFATDGAINHILEAYSGEPIDLVGVSSSMVGDTVDRRQIGLRSGERAVRRISVLRGAHSGRVFVHGSSVVLLDRLPVPVADEVLTTDAGLLTLLTRHGIGSFRESIAEWEGTDDALAAALSIDTSSTLVARTYQIEVGGRPIAWITESFPRDGFPTEPAPEGRTS